MQNLSAESISDIKIINFGCVPVDSVKEENVFIENVSDVLLTYRVSLLYILNNVDKVYNVNISTTPIKPFENAEVQVIFKPNIVGMTFTEYFLIEDSIGNAYRLTVTGKTFGPKVKLNKKQLTFRIFKNVNEQRRQTIDIQNESAVEAIYQWLLPIGGQGSFQISTGNCGVIRAFENITTTVIFTSTALGIYTAELVCLVLHQEPLFLNVTAAVTLAGDPMFTLQDHTFKKPWKISRSARLMENSLNLLSYIPSASVYERHLDFGLGSTKDPTLNISQTVCVTNHELEDGYIQWHLDPDNIFIIDPIALSIPPNESKLFTIRFRPKAENEVFSYLLCGDYQQKRYDSERTNGMKIEHTWFRIPCVGNTWLPCAEWDTEWDCPTQVVLPPTVPSRTTFTNFLLSNKLGLPMHFKFECPSKTNFVVMPMCGIVSGRGWQVISVALEPKTFGDYCENWGLLINRVHKTRICLSGNAEMSDVEVMSHGYDPESDALYEFPPTITGCANYCSTYLHNLTRMEIHMRVLNNASWLGADDNGSIVLPPKEVIQFRWWFFPKEANKVYNTIVTCTCICLIDHKPVGDPTEIFIHIMGFSELPDLRVLPKQMNLHDVVVGQSVSFPITLYNNSSCFHTSKLYHTINGMGDDWGGDKFEIDCSVNSLKPSTHSIIGLTVTPDGAGSRQVSIKYTVLFRTEFNEIEEIQPVTKTICTIWYDGIYPTIKVKRTISIRCPVNLSNHCVWNIANVKEFNNALVDCRPNRPLDVNLYAPDLVVSSQVEFILVMGCVYAAPVQWSLRREKICDCEMVEVQIGISMYEMRHTCIHRPLVEILPLNGNVTASEPFLLHLKFKYSLEGVNTLCFVMSLPNQRTINLYIHVNAIAESARILAPLRRVINSKEYFAILDCGKVPINNLDPVIRILWLYNPTESFTIWRLLRGNISSPDTALRCLQFFGDVAPYDKIAIPFSFIPTEMIDYKVIFYCSVGSELVKILVKGQGGLPNCVETRLDIPFYTEKLIRSAYKYKVVSLSKEHFTLPVMGTHSLSREIFAINNYTDHVYRFIWTPERIGNVINVVMTPWWGVLQPGCCEWITVSVYSLQEPATFTTTVACELLDLTERKRFQQNELLRKHKTEKCHQEFIITEDGEFHRDINDCPPYVLGLKKPEPSYLTLSLSVSSRGQRDGYPRMLLKQMWEHPPQYDMLTSELQSCDNKMLTGNNMRPPEMVRIIDGILWDALHTKMFRAQVEYYSKEEIPTYEYLVNATERDMKQIFSRRVTSGICDAIVNKALFHVYSLKSKRDFINVWEAE